MLDKERIGEEVLPLDLLRPAESKHQALALPVAPHAALRVRLLVVDKAHALQVFALKHGLVGEGDAVGANGRPRGEEIPVAFLKGKGGEYTIMVRVLGRCEGVRV